MKRELQIGDLVIYSGEEYEPHANELDSTTIDRYYRNSVVGCLGIITNTKKILYGTEMAEVFWFGEGNLDGSGWLEYTSKLKVISEA